MTSDAKVQNLVELQLNRDQIIDSIRTCVSLMAENTLNEGSITSPPFMAVLSKSLSDQLDSIQDESEPVYRLQMDRRFTIQIPYSLNSFIKQLSREINHLSIEIQNANYVSSLTDLLEMATTQLEVND